MTYSIIQIEDNPEFFLYKYVIRFNSISDEFNEENESSDFSKHMLHSMISSNLFISIFCFNYINEVFIYLIIILV